MHRKVRGLRSRSSRKGVSSFIAVMALVIVTLAAVGIFSTQLNTVVKAANQDDVKIIDALVTKNYGYTYFTATLKSSADLPLRLDVAVVGDGGTSTFSFKNVTLPASGEITLTQDGFYGDHFFIGNTYVVKVSQDRSLAEPVTCRGTQLTGGKLIILDIAGFPNGDSINATQVANGLEDTALKLGVGVTVITSIGEWNDLLNNPQQGMMIANPYGSLVPSPSSALANPQGFIANLSTTVQNYGWTWIQIGGDPFSTLSDGVNSAQVGSTGLESFLNSPNVNIHKGGTEYIDQNVLTNDAGTSMSYMISVTNITAPPSRMWFDSTIVLPPSDTPTTKYTFYENPSQVSQTGVRSFDLGSGYYVHWGAPCKTGSNNQLDDYYNGAYALMSAIYTNTR